MTDIKMRWDDTLFEGDLVFSGNDLDLDDGFATAVLISLFTDKRASDDDPIPSMNQFQQYFDKRGWWGDEASPDVEKDQIGSKLWLLERSKVTDNVLQIAKGHIEDALKWMIEDGVAVEINAATESQKIKNTYFLAFSVEIKKTDGNVANITFDPEWKESFAAELPSVWAPSYHYRYILTDPDGYILTTESGDRLLAFVETGLP